MNEKKKQEIPMPFKFDDFFTTQEQRDDAVKEKIEEIDISLIDNFKDHPFKVLDNDDMKSLKESIKTSGVLSPVIIREKEDGLIIEGVSKLKGGFTVWSHKDHRIAMTLAIASTVCEEPIIIKDYECVSKSYPEFWNDFKNVGGVFNEWNVGE